MALGWKTKAVAKPLAAVLKEVDAEASLDEIVRRTLAKLMER